MQANKFLGKLITVDNQGSVNLPADMLKAAQITPGSQVEVFANQGGLVLRATEEFCDICGINGAITPYRGKKLCNDCMGGITDQGIAKGHGAAVLNRKGRGNES